MNAGPLGTEELRERNYEISESYDCDMVGPTCVSLLIGQRMRAGPLRLEAKHEATRLRNPTAGTWQELLWGRGSQNLI